MSSDAEINVSAWGSIDDRCPIGCEVYHDSVEFSFGRDSDYLLVFTPRALERMIGLTQRAMVEHREIIAARAAGSEQGVVRREEPAIIKDGRLAGDA